MQRVALVLVGSRVLNKRICRVVESLHESGFTPVVRAVPRNRWRADGSEQRDILTRWGWATARGGDTQPRSQRRPYVVFALHWSVLPLAVLVGFVRRCPVVYDEHDHYELLALETKGPARMRRARAAVVGAVHRWFAPRVDLITCIRLADGRLRDQLLRWNPNVIELHNYPSRRWGAAGRAGSAEDPLVLVYVGGVWDVKGCGEMLDALELLRSDPSSPPLSLHVFGTGDPGLERRLAAAAGVAFHGSSKASTIIDFLAGHDAVGLVLFDSTPRYRMVSTNCHKLFEYLAAGAPVLVTDVGDLPSIVARSGGGWVIPAAHSPEQLAEEFRRIASDRAEVRRRGDTAARTIEREEMWWEAEWEKVVAAGLWDPSDPAQGSTRRG